MATVENWSGHARTAANSATDVMREVSVEIFKSAHVGQLISLRTSGSLTPWAVYTVVAADVTSEQSGRASSSFEPMLLRLDAAGPVLFPPVRAGYSYANPTFDGFRPADAGDLARLLQDYPHINAEVTRAAASARSRGQQPPTPAGHALPNAQVPQWEGH